jgi:hypothetical protein
MGIVKFIPNEEAPSPSVKKKGVFNKLHTTNWRVMTASRTVEAIAVAMSNFKMFEIYNITVEEFLNNNFIKGTVEKPFKYQCNLLSCGVCLGDGYVDWIQKAVSRSSPELPAMSYTYRRNVNYISKFEPLDEHKNITVAIYGSAPKIFDGNELCSTCKGTGVNSMRLLKQLEG